MKECPCQEFNEMFRLLMEYTGTKNELDDKANKLLDRITDKAPQIKLRRTEIEK